ncbi:MAG: hypothetical protein SF162_04950 [bacterium]|nr:hypothetical protein [bacterium]
MITLLIHINNQEPIKLDVEQMPNPTDQAIVGKNPREKTDREVPWVEDGVTTVIFPWWRITFIEVLPSESDAAEFPLPFRND